MPELDQVQLPALALLRDVLGYAVLPGREARAECEAEPWLVGRLSAAMVRISPGLTERGIAQAIAQLRNSITQSLDPIECIEVAHGLLSRWATKPRPPLARGGRVIALIDEAHRTEYGVLHARLHEALPDACIIAFSGTPIPKTLQKFGGYLHRYIMPEAVADGATVPILYESRLPDLAVWGRHIDPMFEAEFAHRSDEQRERLKQKEVTAHKVAEARERIATIAQDIAAHYRENFEPDGFKAQIAASSQGAAARYFEELDRYLPGRVALLISDPAKDATDL